MSTRRIAATREGMMLDRLTHEAGGRDADAVAALSLNPGLGTRLAERGHVLPLDQSVAVPEIDARPRRLSTISLWD
jgi:phage tail protein X